LLSLGGWLAAGACEAANPALKIILPRGVQRGGDRELTFQGERLGDAEEIFLYSSDGLAVKSLTPVDAGSFKAVIHVPDSCPLGEQLVQVRTKSGISEFRTFLVGALPGIDETEPNNAADKTQAIPLGTTVHGIVTNEDIDCFAVELKKGQRLAVEVEGMRLGSAMFDARFSILDANQAVLAVADDASATQQDPILSLVAPEDGRYVVQLRESSYGGSDAARYRLHIGSFPRPTALYPAGGRAGDKMKVTFLGDATGQIEREIDVPAGPVDTTTRVTATDAGGTSPSGVAFRVSAAGNVLEQEPNDDAKAATAGDASSAFNGIIDRPGDVDHFRFAATKGQVFDIECFARRLGSGLDPVLNVLKPDGASIAGNDDARGLDSHIRFTVPEDGDYLVKVTDQLRRGQADFTYRVELTAPTPMLTLSIPRIDRYSQTRQTVAVPRGNRFAILVNATRTNVDGDLVLDGGELPPGIRMTAPPLKAGRTQIPVVFEAAADAPIGGLLATLEARQVTEQDPEGKAGVRGRFTNRADLVLGDPGSAVYHSAEVDRLAVAVVDAVPITVEIVQPKAPLVRNGSMELKVVVKRGEGFAQPVTVEFPFRPPGVAAAPSITIPPDKTEGTYPINADDKAAPGTWPVHVVAAADVGGTAWVASAPVELEVVEPFTVTEIKRVTVEQGKSGRMTCTLTPARPFAGEATARLVGLPAETTAPELKFTAETKEIVFDVRTSPKSPIGGHRSVFVEITTPVNGETSRMTGNRGEVKILAPGANPAAQVAK
jgi:hypothetical protein